MIVGLACFFSSSGAVPLSRELNPLFRSEVGKQPRRIGRTEHLAGLGAVGWTRGWTRLGSLGQRARAVQIKIGPTWRFKADAHARFVERMRAPGRPSEPQSTGGEQRRYCQGQMFCFHCFLLFDSSFTFTFTGALCADSGSWLSFWNEGGEFWCEAPASRNEPDPQPSRLHHLKWRLCRVTILGRRFWSLQ